MANSHGEGNEGFNGAGAGIRTRINVCDDVRLTRPLLYPLSYTRMSFSVLDRHGFLNVHTKIAVYFRAVGEIRQSFVGIT